MANHSQIFSFTAETEEDKAAKVLVIQNMLANLTDKNFQEIKAKLQKKPKLFKEVVKYLKYI